MGCSTPLNKKPYLHTPNPKTQFRATRLTTVCNSTGWQYGQWQVNGSELRSRGDCLHPYRGGAGSELRGGSAVGSSDCLHPPGAGSELWGRSAL
eukprot:1193251-Prorocentrum_minimum.AAC.9